MQSNCILSWKLKRLYYVLEVMKLACLLPESNAALTGQSGLVPFLVLVALPSGRSLISSNSSK